MIVEIEAVKDEVLLILPCVCNWYLGGSRIETQDAGFPLIVCTHLNLVSILLDSILCSKSPLVLKAKKNFSTRAGRV